MADIGNIELLQIADAVAREKNISKDKIFSALEEAMQASAIKKYGRDHNIKATIDRTSGKIKIFRILTVAQEVENPATEISLTDAKNKGDDVELGDELHELLPHIDLNRIAAKIAKGVILRCVNEAEREQIFEDFKSRKSDLINGVVKRIEFGNIYVDLGRVEAVLEQREQIQGEMFKVGDHIKAYVLDVVMATRGSQIFLSRTSNNMLIKLFESEVTEIYENVIEIRAVAREPGQKAKIAVFASDSSVDPVAACIGIKGSKIKAIMREVAGERIDVIEWNPNLADFIISAMAPAAISRIMLDENKRRATVVVAEDQLSLAIGKKGQNVKLASKIADVTIDIVTDDQDTQRRNEQAKEITELFIKSFDIEEMAARLLIAEGYSSVEQIDEAGLDAISAIAGLDDETKSKIYDKATQIVEEKNDLLITELEQLGVEQDLLDTLYLPPESIAALARYGVKTLEDLGEITIEEFKKVVPDSNMSDEEIENLIKAGKSTE